MGEIAIELTGKVIPLKGKGSRQLNNILNERILPVVVEQVTIDITDKARGYAEGIDIPSQMISPVQAKHPIGQSDSEYVSTGKLKDAIRISYSSKTKTIIEALTEYASWLEFGTGIFGPRGQPIFPKKGKLMVFPFKGKTIGASMILGQPPNPFMRGSIWFLKDNLRSTIERIQARLKV